MAYTAPGTAVAGDVLTAVFWNAQVRDNMEAIAGSPLARNILYNGAMQVVQRISSVASITTSGYYTADRWNLAPITMGTWTNSVESDGPSGSGLAKSLKVLCTTADASPAAADQVFVQQIIEGQDLQRMAKGTSSAQQITLSFWVKSNVTGTYTILIYDDDNVRSVSASYTINASATWQKVAITFPADTTGTITNDNTSGMTVRFNLGAGSNFTSGTLATTWGSYTAANTAVGQMNLASATNNYWQVTGVQLETGSVATGFEFLPFGDELRRCQRYYFRNTSSQVFYRFGLGECFSTGDANIYVYNPVELRVPATGIDVTSTASNYTIYSAGATTALATVPTLNTSSTTRITIVNANTASGLTLGRAAQLMANNNTVAYLGVSAEL